GLWVRGAPHGKVGGAFTSTATQHGGQETTLFSIITNLLHFGMVIVGLDYGHAGQMTLDEITGGSPYGATTIAGGDGSRQPTANELQGARYQGRKIAETAKNCTAKPLPAPTSSLFINWLANIANDPVVQGREPKRLPAIASIRQDGVALSRPPTWPLFRRRKPSYWRYCGLEPNVVAFQL